MDNVCFFMSTGVSMFIFIFIFHPPPYRDDTAAAAAPSDEVIDVHACIYKYIIRVRMYGFVCAQLVSIIHAKKKCTKHTCKKKK